MSCTNILLLRLVLIVLCRGGAAATGAPGDHSRGAAGPAVPAKDELSGEGERSAKGGYSAKGEYPAKGEQPGEGGHPAKGELPGEGACRRRSPPR